MADGARARARSEMLGASQASKIFVGFSQADPPSPASILRKAQPSPQRPSKSHALTLHLSKGSIQINNEPLVVGRGMPELADDLRISRNHFILAFDSTKSSATLTWMAKKDGRLQRRQQSSASVLTAGAQVAVTHGDVITLLGEFGRYICVVSIGPPADAALSRPDARSWALLEADALAAARAAAKRERSDLKPLADARTTQSSDGKVLRDPRGADQSFTYEMSAVAKAHNRQAEIVKRLHYTKPMWEADEVPPEEVGLRMQPPEEQQPQPPPPPERAPAPNMRSEWQKAPSGTLPGLSLPSTAASAAAATPAAAAALPTGINEREAQLLQAAAAASMAGPSNNHALVEAWKHRPRWLGGPRVRTNEIHQQDVQLIACTPLDAKDPVVDIGITTNEDNLITSVTPYSDAEDAMLLVGDKLTTFNGKRLVRPLMDMLRSEFIMVGDTVTLGVLRGLDDHMQAQFERAAAAKQPHPPGSPRLMRDSVVDYKGRWRDYRNAPKHLQVGWNRDPYNDQKLAENRWNNGCQDGHIDARML